MIMLREAGPMKGTAKAGGCVGRCRCAPDDDPARSKHKQL